MKIYKFNILLVISLFAIVSLTTCKKYPQDKKLSFETPDRRVRRIWTLTECLVDGDDVTDKEYTLNYGLSNPLDTVIYKLSESTLEFQYYSTRNNPQHSREKIHSCLFAVRSILKHNYIIPTAGDRYSFNNHKCEITFDTNDKKNAGGNYYYSDFPLLFNYTNEPWTIKKLTKTAFIIETTNDIGNKIRVTFKSP